MELKTLWVNPTTMDTLLHNTALSNVLNEYAKLGHDVTLLSIRSRDASQFRNLQVHTKLVPIRYVPIVSSLIFSIVLFSSLPFLISFSKPDIIVLNPDVSILSSIPSLLISKIRKTKFVLDIRSIPVETQGFRGFLTRFWYFISLVMARKWFDGISTLTPLMKNEICNDFDLNPNEVGVWTSGVSESLFSVERVEAQKKELVQRFDLDKNFVVFYHGIFTPTRGLKETVEAMKIIVPRYPDVVFFLLGTGPMTRSLRELIKKEGLQRNVIVHGPVSQSQVPSFIAMSDVGIVPLPDHQFWRLQSPLKLLEYLVMEKVVILTDIPAHRDVIGNARCGIYIQSVQPLNIANGIQYAYSNRKNLKKWGKIGREIVLKKYTWKKVAESLENYFLSIGKQRKN